MAGGIDWFRWHHGSVTDPKFGLIARKSGASLPDVLAIWAFLLEASSMASDRGDFGNIDCEAVDCLFGFPSTETRTANVISAMRERSLIDGNRILAWEKRQPKREREGDTSTDRVKAFRERQRLEDQGNTMKRQETPREEERRKEEKKPKPSRDASAFARFWDAYPKKLGKGKAEKAWAKVDESLLDTMLRAITAHARSEQWQKDGGQFIPYPATWLNERRWEDELAPSAIAKPIIPMIAPDDGKRGDKSVALAEIQKAKGALKARQA